MKLLDIPTKKSNAALLYGSTFDYEDDAACLYCNELYSTSAGVCEACGDCRKWAHISFAAKDEEMQQVSTFVSFV